MPILNNIHDVVLVDVKDLTGTDQPCASDGFPYAVTFIFFANRKPSEYEARTMAVVLAPAINETLSVGTQVEQAEQFGPPPHVDADEARAWQIAEEELNALIERYGGVPPMSEREDFYSRVASRLIEEDIETTDSLMEHIAVRVSLKIKRLP